MSRRELAEMLGSITESGVKYHLDKLKKDGVLSRVGLTNGAWKIIENK